MSALNSKHGSFLLKMLKIPSQKGRALM